jgi:hypothetical protein
MRERKTRFEQVPVEIAKNALRLQPKRPKTIGDPDLLVSNPVRLPVPPKRFRRRRTFRFVSMRFGRNFVGKRNWSRRGESTHRSEKTS